MKILVVDDLRFNRKLMTKYLSAYGECDTAENGLKAIEAVIKAWNEKKPYNLISTDIMMPEINGLEALVKIREFEKKQNIPKEKKIIAIVASSKGDKKSIIKAVSKGGAAAFLIKPVQKEKLIDEFEKLGIKNLPKKENTKV